MRWLNKQEQNGQAGAQAADSTPWAFGPVDLGIAAAMLAVTVAAAVPVAWKLRQATRALDRELMDARSRSRQVQTAIEHLEARERSLTELRRTVGRYVAQVEARPMVSWATAVGEFSRRKPRGVWTTRISADGPRFRAFVSAARPELVTTYVQSLRQSPYVDLAALPPGEAPAAVTQVSGRLMGE